jgi:hypothetical protein
MSNIFVRIVSEFKDSGFKKASKSTQTLGKRFDGLTRSAKRAFVAIVGFTALKRSVNAFIQSDKAVQSLAKSLDNLGLKYEGLGAVKFIEELEQATAVSKEQLFPAFRQLANATLSVTKSQQLLAASLDIAAGTGSSVESVSLALSRAFNGNFTSLGKLQTAYSSAELKAMGFEKSLEVLSDQFSGQAAADADTYDGKIRRLNLALGDAAEAIGEGLVDALEALGGGNYDQGLERIVKFGEQIGDAFRGAARFGAALRLVFSSFGMSWKEYEAAALAINSTFAPEDPAKQRALSRERAKYLKEEQKQTEKIRKDREKSAKLLEKEKNAQKIIAEAQKGFDLERIQIAAALQGKINDVEEFRLKLQRAILNENVEQVVKYSGLLKEAEAQAAELAALLASLPELAENPFTDWPATIARIQYLLKELDWQIPIDVLFAEKGLLLDQDKMTVTKLDTMSVNANSVYVSGNIFGQTAPSGAPMGTTTAAVGGGLPWAAAAPEVAAAIAEADAAAAEAEALVAEAEAVLSAIQATAVLAQFDEIMSSLPLTPGGYGPAEFRMRDEAPAVVVNVAGNVTSETDLVNTITDQLYNYQKAGRGLIYSSVAI